VSVHYSGDLAELGAVLRTSRLRVYGWSGGTASWAYGDGGYDARAPVCVLAT
jgi:hypothetical protein